MFWTGDLGLLLHPDLNNYSPVFLVFFFFCIELFANGSFRELGDDRYRLGGGGFCFIKLFNDQKTGMVVRLGSTNVWNN